MVVFVYHLSPFGNFVVEESEPGFWTLAHMRGRAEAPLPTGSSTESPDPFVMVPVRGTEGLLVQGHGLGRIMWDENGVLFDIFGETLTVPQALELAEKL